MALTLYFKRAKNFVSTDGKGTKKFLAQPALAGQAVPAWVAETNTFKAGIKDGSIVNLTPPHLMPGYEHPAAATEKAKTEPDDAAKPETADTEDAESGTAGEVEDDVEQTELPTAAFGGQPMTPVAPAAKVGGVRASARRAQ